MPFIPSKQLLDRVLKGERFLSDGAVGTELIRQGIDKNDILRTNLFDYEKVIDLHRNYLIAGSQIITTNTFGLRTHEDWANAIQAGISAAMLAVQGSSQEAGVWVSMIPAVALLEIEGLQMLAENSMHWPGAVFLETCTGLQTGLDALKALQVLNLDLTAITCHFNEDGLMADGSTPETAAAAFADAGADLVGANCGENPFSFVNIASSMRSVTDLPVIMQPNAGTPRYLKNGTVEYPISDQEFAEAAKQLYDVGVNIIGGCCGTSPAAIEAVSKKLFHQSIY